MSVVTSANEYLEGPYLEGPYLVSTALGSLGFQSTIVIQDEAAKAFQAHITIADFKSPQAMQARITIANALKQMGMQSAITINAQDANGMQSAVTINAQDANGMQSQINIADDMAVGMQSAITVNEQSASGMQSEINIENFLYSQAIQAEATIVDNLTAKGMQSTIVVNADKSTAMQAMVLILDTLESTGMQVFTTIQALTAKGFEVRVDKYPTSICASGGYLEGDYLESPYLTEIFCTRPGMQASITISNFLKHQGMQSQIQIANRPVAVGMQSLLRIVDYTKPVGMQALIANTFSMGMQTLATIYNTVNLRILCDFPSRGLTTTNWSANSTAAGDFSPQNLDTDIVEQVWRSTSITGVRVTTDTGLPQGVFLDTMAILNHNFTRSANVVLIGSNDPSFSTIGITIPIPVREKNIYYIAPTLPTAGYRYWRFDLDDATNPDGFLQIGTIVFGASEIFQGECFVDEIEFELRDFSDTVRTEGFTNVANSRTQKRRVRLEFRFLQLQKRNFRILRDMFENDRTTHKCLWIPTPSATDQEVTARFASFAKLTSIPVERHNNKGPLHDYVSFTIEVDESL